jgi:hypothetical protein
LYDVSKSSINQEKSVILRTASFRFGWNGRVGESWEKWARRREKVKNPAFAGIGDLLFCD